MKFFHYSSFIIHHSILLFLIASAALAASPAPIETLQATPQRIVVLDFPKRHDAASFDSEFKQTGWRAGESVTWTEIRAGDDRTSRVLAGNESITTAPLNIWYKIEHEGKTGWLPDAALAVPGTMDASTTIGVERVDRWTGLAPDYKPDDMVPVGPGYETDRRYLLRKEAAGALTEMIEAARADGIKLKVVSGYRQWQTQQDLYQNRVNKSGMGQQTVAKPGHSEHQLGTAVDLTDGNEAALLEQSFAETKAGRWLKENAPRYGFINSYTKENAPETGIAPEPWHYRYWGKAVAR